MPIADIVSGKRVNKKPRAFRPRVSWPQTSVGEGLAALASDRRQTPLGEADQKHRVLWSTSAARASSGAFEPGASLNACGTAPQQRPAMGKITKLNLATPETAALASRTRFDH